MKIEDAQKALVLSSYYRNDGRPTSKGRGENYDSFQRNDDRFQTDSFCGSSPSLKEKFQFFAERVFNDATGDSRDVEGFRRDVLMLSSRNWHERFTSRDSQDRVTAYWEYQGNRAGSLTMVHWRSFSDRVLRRKETIDIVKLRILLNHFFGDIPFVVMREEAREKEMFLEEEGVKRRYQARILRDSFATKESVCGSDHERDAQMIRQVVRHCYETFRALRRCLDDPKVAQRLQLVPKSAYEGVLPKKDIRRASLVADGLQSNNPGTSLFSLFPSLSKAKNECPAPSPWMPEEATEEDFFGSGYIGFLWGYA